MIFGNSDFTNMLINTLGINLIGNVVNILAAITFSLLINESCAPRFKSFCADRDLHAPLHFVGCVRQHRDDHAQCGRRFLQPCAAKLGLIDEPIVFMADPNYFWGIAIYTYIY